jgi:hypothetical protein
MPNGAPLKRIITTTLNAATVDGIIRSWPPEARKAADKIIAKYGMPHEATETMLVWNNNAPWKQTIIHREGVPHHFPAPHIDIVDQIVDYKVPPEKHNDLAAYDGSVYVERTKGEMGVCCGAEEMNILALNLAHEIVLGRKTVAEARQKYAESMMALASGWPVPAATQLQFLSATTPSDMEYGTPRTADPDQATMVDSFLAMTKDKIGAVMRRAKRALR